MQEGGMLPVWVLFLSNLGMTDPNWPTESRFWWFASFQQNKIFPIVPYKVRLRNWTRTYQITFDIENNLLEEYMRNSCLLNLPAWHFILMMFKNSEVKTHYYELKYVSQKCVNLKPSTLGLHNNDYLGRKGLHSEIWFKMLLIWLLIHSDWHFSKSKAESQR